MHIKPLIQIAALALAVGSGIPWANGDTAGKIEKPVQQSITTRQSTQKAEERWREEKASLVARYEQLQRENRQLKERRAELETQVAATAARLAARRKQLVDIEQISTQIEPFLVRLVSDIKAHLASDLPFLPDERRSRIQRLENLLADPEVAISEKYRKVMEALLIETEYGFTMETYQATISVNAQEMRVNIFRLGRLNLYYQRRDGRQAGFYNVAAKAWQPLPDNYNPAIGAAIDIAAKRQPVEMLSLPLGRLVTP